MLLRGLPTDLSAGREALGGFPYGSDGKNLPAMQETPVRSGRPLGEENGNPLQYSCLENSMDRRTWWATVHGVAQRGHG